MNITIVFKDGRAIDYNRVYNIKVDEEILFVNNYGLEGQVNCRRHKVEVIAQIIVKMI